MNPGFLVVVLLGGCGGAIPSPVPSVEVVKGFDTTLAKVKGDGS